VPAPRLHPRPAHGSWGFRPPIPAARAHPMRPRAGRPCASPGPHRLQRTRQRHSRADLAPPKGRPQRSRGPGRFLGGLGASRASTCVV